MPTSKKIFIPISIAIILFVITIIGLFGMLMSSVTPQDNVNTIDTNNPLVTKVDTGYSEDFPSTKESDPYLGNPTAPVTIYIFGNLSATSYRQLYPRLLSLTNKYPEKIKLVWKDFPLTSIHPDALPAHLAGYCAHQQQAFWPMHDRLLQQTTAWTEVDLKNLAAQLQLDTTKFNGCLSSTGALDSIASNINEAAALKLDDSPYLFVNDQRVPLPVSDLELEQLITFHGKQ